MKIDIFSTDKKYDIIYADPPWEYPLSGGIKNSRGMAKQHYTTMGIDEVGELPIKRLCTPTALCFLWATFPNIENAIHTISEWGFIYKTAAFVWIKKNKCGSNFWGMGQYTRANAEVCLLGVSKRTKASEQVKSHKIHQIVESVVGRHSEKPNEVRERIVQLLGDIPRIELFAREQVEGWDCWGDEV